MEIHTIGSMDTQQALEWARNLSAIFYSAGVPTKENGEDYDAYPPACSGQGDGSGPQKGSVEAAAKSSS
jgi:hypothetical protein